MSRKAARTKSAPMPEFAENRAPDAAGMGHTPEAVLALVTNSLDDDKAEDIVTIPLAGKSPIADYMVIASGRSTRQVKSIADHLLDRLKDGGFGSRQAEGMTEGDWVLVDAGDVIIHVFRPEIRNFYNLEKMWQASIPADA